MSNEFLDAPIDHSSSQALAIDGLRLGLVNTAAAGQFRAWLEVEARGFHSSAPTDESIAGQIAGLAYRRTTGVWDDLGTGEAAADTEPPLATVSSWSTPLTVPGARTVDAWAISAVTVSPTHRRRGIARALVEAELRTADALGVPVAMLTVSEATIYGRFGFAPAVMAADWRIDTRRATWAGPVPHGRVRFITAGELRELAPLVAERVRLNSPGEIEPWPLLWDRIAGLTEDDKEIAKDIRAVRYDDTAGHPQGFAVYRVSENTNRENANRSNENRDHPGNGDLFGHTLEVFYLASATDDAYAGLWRYLLEMDLVTQVVAKLRSTDEAFAWQVSDFRAARRTMQRDHLWTRILDVKGALEARRYSAHGRILLQVTDPLGFAEGRFLLEIAEDGNATVSELDGETPDDAAAIALSVNALSALYLGGVSAVTLTLAGSITELRDGSSSAVDASFRAAVTPWLSIWF